MLVSQCNLNLFAASYLSKLCRVTGRRMAWWTCHPHIPPDRLQRAPRLGSVILSLYQTVTHQFLRELFLLPLHFYWVVSWWETIQLDQGNCKKQITVLIIESAERMWDVIQHIITSRIVFLRKLGRKSCLFPAMTIELIYLWLISTVNYVTGRVLKIFFGLPILIK